VGITENGEAAPATAGPSRTGSPGPDAAAAPAGPGPVLGGLDEMCIGKDGAGKDCPGTAATRCPTRACLLHCREIRAVAGGMDQPEAFKQAQAGGLVGMGCDAHEAKHLARVQRRQEKNQIKADAKRMKQKGQRKRKRDGRSGSPVGDKPAKTVKEGEDTKEQEAKGEKGQDKTEDEGKTEGEAQPQPVAA
jgi:tRNA-dihydrouridine synthase 1